MKAKDFFNLKPMNWLNKINEKTQVKNVKVSDNYKKETEVVMDNMKNNSLWSELKPIELSKIVKVTFPDTKYFKEETPKHQIVIHHTVSGPKVDGDISTWLSGTNRIATHVIIDRNGIVYQCFGSRFWAHHIGVKSDFLKGLGFKDYGTRNVTLNKSSISIELDSWGQLEKLGQNKYKTYYGSIINLDDKLVTKYDAKFKDNMYYESYTIAQLKSLGELLLLWNKTYSIPLEYQGDAIFNVDKDALSGKAGVFTHVSYRSDKSDCHPDANLKDLLKTISTLI